MMDAADLADAKSKILAPATGRPFSQKAISEHADVSARART
jgi:hypothetical protein